MSCHSTCFALSTNLTYEVPRKSEKSVIQDQCEAHLQQSSQVEFKGKEAVHTINIDCLLKNFMY
jgi:hypothetical protein